MKTTLKILASLLIIAVGLFIVFKPVCVRKPQITGCFIGDTYQVYIVKYKIPR